VDRLGRPRGLVLELIRRLFGHDLLAQPLLEHGGEQVVRAPAREGPPFDRAVGPLMDRMRARRFAIVRAARGVPPGSSPVPGRRGSRQQAADGERASPCQVDRPCSFEGSTTSRFQSTWPTRHARPPRRVPSGRPSRARRSAEDGVELKEVAAAVPPLPLLPPSRRGPGTRHADVQRPLAAGERAATGARRQHRRQTRCARRVCAGRAAFGALRDRSTYVLAVLGQWQLRELLGRPIFASSRPDLLGVVRRNPFVH
jgi:hypothetical protein